MKFGSTKVYKLILGGTIMKKPFSILRKATLGVMVLTMLASSSLAFAADATVDPVTGSTVDVVGEVRSTTLVVTVPTSLSFVIDPNSATVFTSVPATVVNGTKAPIDFKVLGVTSDTGTDTKVIANTAYTDAEWLALGKADTSTKIALGVKEVQGASTIWSAAEVADTTPSTVAGTMKLDPSGSKSISVDARHGLAWGSAKTLNYNLYVRVGLTQD
jgi:hypothetical protein